MYWVINMKQRHEAEMALQIDYELFTTEEIVKIFNFYSLIERTKHQNIKKDELLNAYKEYRNIINNIALQKKYDKNFEKVSGVSIYQIITSCGGKY